MYSLRLRPTIHARLTLLIDRRRLSIIVVAFFADYYIPFEARITALYSYLCVPSLRATFFESGQHGATPPHVEPVIIVVCDLQLSDK